MKKVEMLLGASVAALMAVPANAQDVNTASQYNASPDSVGSTDNVIIVTAQKRAQREVDVPISLSAFSGETLERLGIDDLNEIADITPGFVMQLQDKFAPGFSIRGITSNDFSPQGEQRVAVFIDGVPATQTTAAYSELFDIDRIEIERGPQSSLHGRSALNGGVSIYHTRPKDEFGAEVGAGIGTYGYYTGHAIVNVPVSDTLAIRAGGLIKARDGYVKDIYHGESYNQESAKAFRAALAWKPSSDFSFTLNAAYDIDDTKGGVPFKSATFLPRDQETGEVIGDTKFWTPAHLSTFGDIPDPYFKRDILNLSATTEWTLNENVSFTSILGYRWFDACQSGDNDGTTTNIIAYEQCNNGDQYSVEARLNLTDIGPLSGFIGANYLKAKNGLDFRLGFDERAMALFLGGKLQSLAPMGLTTNEIAAALGPAAGMFKAYHEDYSRSTADVSTFDLFGDFTLDLTDRFQAFAGARMTWDSKDVTTQGLLPTGPSSLTGAGLFFQPTANGAVLSGSNDSTAFTGRGGVRYEITPSVNAYATIGLGKRPEVPNIASTGVVTVVPKEAITSYEAGLKYALDGGRIVGSTSVYHYSYSNFQTQGLVEGKTATINAGKADATGVETQLTLSLGENVSIYGSYAYSHARFGNGIYEGNQFRNSPDHTFAIGGTVGVSVGDDHMLSFSPVYNWRSKMYFFDDNDRLDLQQRTPAAYSDTVVDEVQKSFGLLQAKISLAPTSGQWNFDLVGENLFDKKFLVDAGNLGDSFGIPTFIAGTRRNFRAEFTIKF